LLGFLVLLVVVVPTSAAFLAAVVGAAVVGVLAAAGLVFLRAGRLPSDAVLAKRADRVLGLPDDLLAGSEMGDDADRWTDAARRRTAGVVEAAAIRERWPVVVPVRTRWMGGVTAGLAVMFLAVVGVKWSGEMDRIAALEAARDARVASAAEVVEDWEAFAEMTDDPELKKFFAEALELRNALVETDPMVAMLKMNELEAAMGSLEEEIAEQSLASQSAAMAEALEAFEGLGAMSAALRNQDFDAAATEAAKRAAELGKDPGGKSGVRRNAAVSEMLATEAKTAAARGSEKLSNTLSELSKAARQAQKSTGVPNDQLGRCLGSLQGELTRAGACKSRGRMLALTKQQLDELRRRMMGQKSGTGFLPSLCQSMGNKPGGKKAGTGTAGEPAGDATDLAAAGMTEQLTGVAGDGESEVRTLADTQGSATAASVGREQAFAEYAELSKQAVADENLPLAHRRLIRTYFERIRPVADGGGL
jgi:hypothetical protein